MVVVVVVVGAAVVVAGAAVVVVAAAEVVVLATAASVVVASSADPQADSTRTAASVSAALRGMGLPISVATTSLREYAAPARVGRG